MGFMSSNVGHWIKYEIKVKLAEITMFWKIEVCLGPIGFK